MKRIDRRFFFEGFLGLCLDNLWQLIEAFPKFRMGAMLNHTLASLD